MSEKNMRAWWKNVHRYLKGRSCSEICTLYGLFGKFLDKNKNMFDILLEDGII